VFGLERKTEVITEIITTNKQKKTREKKINKSNQGSD
jgi:hypothetical protein